MDKIVPVRVTVTEAKLDLENKGVTATVLRDGRMELSFRGAMPDIIAYLQNETELTKAGRVGKVNDLNQVKQFTQFHIPTLIRPAATFSHPMGEGICFVGRFPGVGACAQRTNPGLISVAPSAHWNRRSRVWRGSRFEIYPAHWNS